MTKDEANLRARLIWDDIYGRNGGDAFLGEIDAGMKAEILAEWELIIEGE